MKGHWACVQIIDGNGHFLGAVSADSECDGDLLYDHMEEMGWVDDMDAYDVDGDSEYIAVCAKSDESPKDFGWYFISEMIGEYSIEEDAGSACAATDEGDGADCVYWDLVIQKDGFYTDIWVDCDSNRSVSYYGTEGPFKSEEEARYAGFQAANRWMTDNGIPLKDVEYDGQTTFAFGRGPNDDLFA